MIYKNIDIHNCREILKNDETGLYMMSRIPVELNDKIEGNAFQDSGVELRFVPNDDEIKIVLRTQKDCAVRAIIYFGSIQSGWEQLYKTINPEPTEIVIKKPHNIELLQRITDENGFPFSPNVVRVILTNGIYEIGDVIGDCRPPKDDEVPQRKYLAYGSSITHGSLGMVQPNTYVSRVGEAFNADVTNMGFAGNARLESDMAEYIANDCYFDFATIEMGINILDIPCDDFENRVRNFVSTIAKAHSDKPIFCIDVFYMYQDMEEDDAPNCKPRAFREIVKRVIGELNFKNVTYIRGTDLMCGSRFLSQDSVHPNARGMEEISVNLIKTIKNKIC